MVTINNKLIVKFTAILSFHKYLLLETQFRLVTNTTKFLKLLSQIVKSRSSGVVNVSFIFSILIIKLLIIKLFSDCLIKRTTNVR